VKVKNRTSDILFRTNFGLDSGMWRHFPEETINPGSEVIFGSESYGLCTGTGGFVEYSIAGHKEPFRLSWEVPFFGSGSSSVSEHQNYRIGREEWLSRKNGTVEFSIHDPYEGDYRNNEKEVRLVSAAPVIFETWKVQMQKAQRSVLFNINNTTDFILRLNSAETHNGIWSLEPVKEILPQTEADFGAESQGLLGTAGVFSYTIIDRKREVGPTIINFSWKIGLFGDPTYDSNIFAIVPQQQGNHCVVALFFSSDETFMLPEPTLVIAEPTLDFDETEIEKQDISEPRDQYHQTSYGFDGDSEEN